MPIVIDEVVAEVRGETEPLPGAEADRPQAAAPPSAREIVHELRRAARRSERVRAD
ncbi:MAG TPA: hypothetical protein VFE05_06110 [Longimicrobiaceae bacterium]|nr:hypothetical protein [Longimicrobiaceae bacterium]